MEALREAMDTVDYNPTPTARLDLCELRTGIGSGVSPSVGAAFAEAASVSFVRNDHEPGASMLLDGDVKHEVSVHWELDNPAVAERSWGDPDVAAEWGAYGIAALLVDKATGCTIAERSRKGTGFDFWLRDKRDTGVLFQDAGRLEVSGLTRGTNRDVKRRVAAKERQVQRLGTCMASMVAVIEFGKPQSVVTTHAKR